MTRLHVPTAVVLLLLTAFTADADGMDGRAVEQSSDDPTEGRFPWPLMRALAPFGRFPREIMEVRPFEAHAMRLDESRLTGLLSDVPCTSLNAAVTATLRT